MDLNDSFKHNILYFPTWSNKKLQILINSTVFRRRLIVYSWKLFLEGHGKSRNVMVRKSGNPETSKIPL